jgi:hypothetical protein
MSKSPTDRDDHDCPNLNCTHSFDQSLNFDKRTEVRGYGGSLWEPQGARQRRGHCWQLKKGGVEAEEKVINHNNH